MADPLGVSNEARELVEVAGQVPHLDHIRPRPWDSTPDPIRQREDPTLKTRSALMPRSTVPQE